MKEDKVITDAKASLKYQIKFLESLLTHIRNPESPMRSNAVWTSWAINEYMQHKLITDVKNAMDRNKAE